MLDPLIIQSNSARPPLGTPREVQEFQGTALLQEAEPENFKPEEFLRLGQDPTSITARGAKLFKTDVETYINWRWHMKHQVTTAAEAQRSWT